MSPVTESKRKVWTRLVQQCLIAMIIGLGCFLTYLLVTNSKVIPSPTALPPGSIGIADATISDFVFTQTKDDVVQWQVQAKEGKFFEKDKQMILRAVSVDIFGKQGKELMITGDEGVLNTETKNFVISNQSQPLEVHIESGYVIYTNHIAWTDLRREVSTKDFIRIVGHGLKITGHGLLGRLDTQEFEILEDVHVDLVSAF